jgi:hypothetical protein
MPPPSAATALWNSQRIDRNPPSVRFAPASGYGQPTRPAPLAYDRASYAQNTGYGQAAMQYPSAPPLEASQTYEPASPRGMVVLAKPNDQLAYS